MKKIKWIYQEPRDVFGVGRVQPGDIIEVSDKLAKQLIYQKFGKEIKEKVEKKTEKIVKDKGGK